MTENSPYSGIDRSSIPKLEPRCDFPTEEEFVRLCKKIAGEGPPDDYKEEGPDDDWEREEWW